MIEYRLKNAISIDALRIGSRNVKVCTTSATPIENQLLLVETPEKSRVNMNSLSNSSPYNCTLYERGNEGAAPPSCEVTTLGPLLIAKEKKNAVLDEPANFVPENQRLQRDFRQNLLQLQKEGFLCDTVIVGDDCQIKAHSIILAAASDQFKVALATTDKLEEHAILVRGVERCVLQVVVNYAYTGILEFPEESSTSSQEFRNRVLNLLQQFGFDVSSAIPRIENVHLIEDDAENALTVDQDKEASDRTNEYEAMSADVTVPSSCSSDADTNSGSNKESSVSVSNEANGKQNVVTTPCTSGSGMDGSVDERAAVRIRKTSLRRPQAVIFRGVSQLCYICGRHFPSAYACRKHVSNHNYTRRQCSFCGLKFTYNSSLKRHLMQHTGYRPNVCRHCGSSFIQRQALQDHIATRHPDEVETDPACKKLICRRCGLSFYQSWKYQYHLRSECSKQAFGRLLTDGTNSLPERFMCQKCGRHFTWKASLLIHESWSCMHLRKRLAKNRIITVGHTGSRSFLCTVCGKTLSSLYALETHQRLHNGEMPFKCPICDWRTRQQSSLLYHVLGHTGELRDKKYQSSCTLRDCQSRLTGERKKCSCSICGKVLSHPSHLTPHMRTHTGEKPYQCQLCSKAYRQNVDLRNHSQRVHQITLPKRRVNNQKE